MSMRIVVPPDLDMFTVILRPNQLRQFPAASCALVGTDYVFLGGDGLEICRFPKSSVVSINSIE